LKLKKNSIYFQARSQNLFILLFYLFFLARSQNYEKRPLASPGPSVRMEKLGSLWMDFHEIDISVFFENLSQHKKFRLH
jgi:hypothetical protein